MIWVLLLISGNPNVLQIFVNTFDSKVKCEKRITEMDKSYKMTCIKTQVNK